MNTRYYKHKLENLININKIVTIHYFQFNKNFKGPTESHDFWELVYADKGELICEADGKEILLSQGEILFHKPNEVHTLRTNGRSAPDVFIVCFDCKSECVRFFENLKLTLNKRFVRFIYSIIEESKKTFDLPYADPQLKKMHLLPSPTLGGQQVIKNYLEILLISLMRDETEKSDSGVVFLPREESRERLADKIIKFLQANLYEQLEISDVCEALHYNKSYIFRQFKATTDCTIMAYFIKLKIEEAKRLLRETSLSVTQISAKLAFDTPNYFSKTFKKITGYTPLRYKRLTNR